MGRQDQPGYWDCAPVPFSCTRRWLKYATSAEQSIRQPLPPLDQNLTAAKSCWRRPAIRSRCG